MAARVQLRYLGRGGRGFRRLYATRVSSATADGVFQAGLASYVFFNPQNATTPGRAAAAFAALLLPYSLIGPFAGVFLDRWRRQRVLVVGNAAKVALVVGVAVLVGLGDDGAAFVALAVAALGINRFFLAALSAALPHVVDADWLVTANALSTTSGSVATIAGAGIGGGLRLLIGSGGPQIGLIVGLSALGYAGSAAVAATLPSDALGPDATLVAAAGSSWRAVVEVARDLRRAAAHAWRRRRVADALGAVTAHRFLYGVATLTIVLLYRNYFSSQADVTSGLVGLGAVLGASGAGIVVAALITPGAARRIGTSTWIAALLAAAGCSIAIFGLPFERVLLVVGSFVLGVTAQGVKICVDTTVQRGVDDEFRGRVFSVYDMLFNVSYVAAAAAAALVLPTSGKSTVTMIVLSVGYLIAAAGYSWRSRRDLADERHDRRGHGGVALKFAPVRSVDDR